MAPAPDLGPAQIGLYLAAAPQLMVVWRVDTGWYYVDFGQGRPLVAPTGHLDGPDPLARLLPHAVDAARWISGLADGQRTGTTSPPPPVTTELAPVLRDRLLEYGSAAVRPYLDAEPIG